MAQNERWRNALHMQVERVLFTSGERVSNAWVTYLRVGDNTPNGVLIPNDEMGLRSSSLKVASTCKLPLWDGPASY